jgi:hypothetical protein
MASIKEDLIKLTDFPFAYTSVGLILVITFGTKIDWTNPLEEYLPILFFVGIIGTIISITDPFGKLTKLLIRIRYMIKKSELDSIIQNLIFLMLMRIEVCLDEELSKYEKDLKNKNIDLPEKRKINTFIPDVGYSQQYKPINPDLINEKYSLYEDLRGEKKFSKNELLSNFEEIVSFGSGIDEPESKKASPFINNSLKTNWINYEIDKLVSNFYFLIILSLIITLIANIEYYQMFLNFVNTNENNNSNKTETPSSNNSNSTIKNSELFSELRIPILQIFTGSFFGILAVFLYSTYKLSSKLVIVGFYLFVLTKRYIDTQQSKDIIDSLNTYLETHDWGMAREYVDTWYRYLRVK